jgi:hypothetical protein
MSKKNKILSVIIGLILSMLFIMSEFFEIKYTSLENMKFNNEVRIIK